MKNIMLVVVFVMSTGCSTVADLTIQSVAGAVGGALGNMADRRMERALGNLPEEEDKKLEPKLKEEKKHNEYKNSQDGKR
tara:strand:- start:252 stop:491 length:240 start_codon:yes stop_codon:yes gene_type:complete